MKLPWFRHFQDRFLTTVREKWGKKGLFWELPDHLQSQNPEAPISSKKISEKVRKVQKIVDFNCFLDFSDTFSELFGGPGSRGPKLLLGDSFETFRGVLAKQACCVPGFEFLTFRGPFASHDSNPYPNRWVLFCPTFREKSSGPLLIGFYRFYLPSPE